MASIHPDLIVSVSGIRGLVGHSLTPFDAVRFAQAYGSILGKQSRVAVSRDGRPSGHQLAHAVSAGLLSVGCEVIDLGISPTPSVGLMVTRHQLDGAIQVTASHNPSEWNGLKMFGSDGSVLSAQAGRVVLDRFLEGNIQEARWDEYLASLPLIGVADEHTAIIAETVDRDHIAEVGFRVLIDANGGSGGPFALKLFERLKVESVPIGCEPTGLFAHEPEPIPAHLGTVADQVASGGLAAGFVLDPDADRLALIDETGQCVSEEVTLALAVKFKLGKKPGPVVINMSSSRMAEDVASGFGQPCYRTAVGEANVVAGIRSRNAIIGGEGNGGVIDPEIGWVRDPFIAMAQILNLMADTGQTLSQLVRELPQYHMLKTKFPVAKDRLPEALQKIRSAWPEAEVDTTDGLRLAGSDWWLHVRPSNTEPVVRVIAEASTREHVEQLCEQAAKIVTQ